MSKITKTLSAVFTLLVLVNFSYANENFYDQAIKEFDKKKYDEAKFLLERNIVFNPKDAKSYLYLAKIFKEKENKKEEKNNLDTALLLDPSNEDATLRLMDIAVENSNYSEVKELSEKFVKICKNLCKENERILESLKDLEPKNDS
ncbi:tetratricopeptide repeat protein [Candidatus Pelagibacter sp.]|uniref:tetratricopeptide repeat protein n=1 Tax=Candidatus Pelagibacter sp. TaxID=2024849 RepID=UPI003F8568A3